MLIPILLTIIIGTLAIIAGLYMSGLLSDITREQIGSDGRYGRPIDVIRGMIGMLMIAGGFGTSIIGAFLFYSSGEFTTIAIGAGLLLIGFILMPIPHMGVIRNLFGMRRLVLAIALMVGGILTLLIWIISMDTWFIIAGVCLLVLGIVTLPSHYRENIFRFFRIRERYLEIPKEKHMPRKKPKGFTRVGEKEYAKIPEDAIDPYTGERIHDLIAQGKSIIRCRDCGAYYDKEVWGHYGKICVRIGCSNAEV